ncbi:3-phosphoshikimate 1-carboxyvinyltransferase [uncultured Sphaerochaeta sp.]|uniref:3-phosphoshikimate 1-carboxyvinyltransferase n=1 Tax=uncultured Sphaerochaeta sp. TaxID=886478 RepID=UPI002A0A1EB9|nr:3-phosphoshikimate 1-carboxyvinyltransferase [uncultured Sphaerochaeta sp.]
MDKTFVPTPVGGTITIPGSKSQTIRALLIATLSGETSIIHNALDSQDTQSCMDLCTQLGAVLTWNDNHDTLNCNATKIKNLKGSHTLDCGNSGTTLYLATGMLASLPGIFTFTGDGQLQKRPIGPLLDALEALGATIVRKNGTFPPFSIEGPLRGGSCSIECPTSQYLSGLLLACCLSKGDCNINVPLLYEKPYVNLTLQWMNEQNLYYEISADLQKAKTFGNQHFKGFEAMVTGDFSSASFFFCMAAIGKTKISVKGLNAQDVQGDKKILDILSQMGCTVTWEDTTVTLEGPQQLKGGTFDLNSMPDTLPILAVTACFAQEDVHLVNVPQARIKETDRIAVMHEELARLGAQIEEQEDGMTIKAGHPLHGGTVYGHDDHRVIMALSAASIALKDRLHLIGIDAASITFPSFFNLFDSIRGDVL